MLLQVAQKCKKAATVFLLFSLLNIITFIPGSHLPDAELVEAGSVAHASFGDEEEVGLSTILEFILEDIVGLEDSLPDAEKPEVVDHYISAKLRNTSSPLPVFLSSNQEPEFRQPVIAHQTFNFTGAENLPHLQHHNFVFRLTPF